MTGKKQLVVNIVANLLAFGIQFGINFFLTPYIINSLGSEAYGFIPLTNNIVGFADIVTVAFYSMTGRFIAFEVSRGNMEKASRYFTSSTIANCSLTALLIIPSALVTIFADRIIHIPAFLIADVKLTFAFSFINMFISMSFAAYGAVFIATNRVDINARKNIESNLIRASLLVCLFTFFAPKVYYINATMLIVSIYLLVINIHYTHKLLPEMRFGSEYFHISSIKELLSAGVWNSLNQASFVLLGTLDLFLANLLAGSVATGEYSVAKTVPNLIQSIVSVLIPVFVPQFTIYYAKKQKDKMLDSISFSVRIMGFLCAIPIGFLMVFGREFFALWVPTQNADTLHGLSVITLLGMVVMSSASVVEDVFTATAKLKVPAIVLLIAGLTNTVLVVVLMKTTSLGIWAIPLFALLIALVRGAVFIPLYAAHCLKVSRWTFYPSLIRSVICIVVMVITCEAYRLIVPPANSWLLLFVAGVCCATLACLVNLFLVLDRRSRGTLYVMVRSKLKW